MADGNTRSKPPTIKDVANHLGIAFSTVSRALHDHKHVSSDVKKRVAEAARELGYIPNASARLMRSSRSPTIGLIIPDFQNQLFAAAANEISRRCVAAGLALLLAITNDDPETELREIESMIEARVSGIAIASCGRTLERSKELLGKLPSLQLLARDESLQMPTIMLDDYRSLEMATRHLIQLGHERIAFIGGRDGLGTADRRYCGYRDALISASIVVAPELVQRGSLTAEFGRMAATHLLQLRAPPTAAVVANSLQTEGLIGAVVMNGIQVPSELSIVGHGDPSWFKLWGPGLTTIDTKPLESSATFADWLISRTQDTTARPIDIEPLRLILPTSLVQRGSTAPRDRA